MRHIFLFTGLLVSLYSYAIIPDRKYVRLPHEVGLIYKELDVTTKDGYRIETWFYPAQDVPAQDAGQTEMLPYKTIDDSRRPTLIICNGDAGHGGTEFPFFVDWGRWAEETVGFMLD